MAEKNKGFVSTLLSNLFHPFSPGDPKVLFEGEGDHSHITVLEKDGIRTMYMGPECNESESSVKVTDPDAPVFEYPGLVLLSLALCPLHNTDILLVGLGGGFIPRLFQNYLPIRNLTVVEIDPLVAELSEKFFYFTPGENVTLEIDDGLNFIASSPERHYDQIWMDAFNGDYIPPHLSTGEFLEICRLHLKPGGLLTQNLHLTKKERYFKQLSLTTKIFGESPMVFYGERCANSVIMSFNAPPKTKPLSKKDARELAKKFGPDIGPYNLIQEANKMVKCPTLPYEC
jgi:spermidine synthase